MAISVSMLLYKALDLNITLIGRCKQAKKCRKKSKEKGQLGATGFLPIITVALSGKQNQESINQLMTLIFVI